MSALTVPLSVPRADPTAREAIARADAGDRARPLTVPFGAYVGVCFKPGWLASKLGRDVVRAASGGR